MRTLQSQIGWCNRAQWALTITMVALLGGFYLLDYRPITTRLRDLKLETSAKQRRLDINESRARTLPIVKAEVDQLRRRLEHFDKKLPKQQDLGQFIESIARLREGNGLRNFSLVRSEPTRADLFSQIPIKIDFEGDFLDVFSFLRQTDEMQRLTRLRNLSVKVREGGTGQVDVKLEMNIYYSEG